MALNIREASGDDLPQLVYLGREFADHSPYAKYWDEDQLISAIYRLLSMETAGCFVAEKDGDVVGFIYGILGNLWFNQMVPVVSELAWWVTQQHRGRAGIMLLSALEGWARERKAVILSMSELATFGKGVGAMLTRRGFSQAENSYCKHFTHGCT